MSMQATPSVDALGAGTRVEIVNRFEQDWSRGFEVSEVVADGYRIRRLSDGAVLPAVFPGDDVRAG